MAILQKRSLTSGSIPTTSSLAVGEIAMNVPDGRIYLRKSGSGSDTIQSAITTGAQNSGSVFLTGSLSISGTGSVFDVAGDVLEFSGDVMEFTGSFTTSGSMSVIGVYTVRSSGSTLMLITGSRGELFKVLDSGSTSILAVISSGSTNVMTVTTSSVDVVGSMSVTSTLRLSDIVDPTSFPISGSLIYSKTIAGRSMPKYIDPNGVDFPFQTNIGFNNISVIGPGGGSTIDTLGCTVTSVGIISNPDIASTNLKAQTRRIVNTSANTAGSLASIRVGAYECFRGNATNIGGFFVVCRFGLTTLAGNNRAFFGLSDQATAAPTNVDPLTSTTIGKIGMACSANSGSWSLVNNVAATSPTVLSLGTSFPVDTTTLYEMILSSKVNGTAIDYRLTNMSSSVQISGSISTNIPTNVTPLGRQAWMTNNTTATAVAFDLSRFYLETDY